MASVHDVAAAILDKTGTIDTFKLQKLVYYSQAWHLVWASEPLFDEPIQAWAGGPVVPTLYELHKGRYSVSSWPDGNTTRLTDSERATIDAVVLSYGKLSGRQLSELTHREEPWRNARGSLDSGTRGSQVIEPGSIQNYYSGLDQDPEAVSVENLSEMDEDAPF